MQFIDAHCHIDFEVFDADRQALLEQCERAGVVLIVVPGVERATWSRVLKLSTESEALKPCLGLHPCFLGSYHDSDLEALEALLKARTDVVAVGEIGLDFTVDNEALQIELLERQIELANRYSLPVVMHSRKAHNQLLQVIKRTRPRYGGLLHGFSGSVEQALSFWQEGIYLGVGGVITYPRAKKSRRTMGSVPLESIVLETDSPDMPMKGRQGHRNTPLAIPDIFRELCGLRSEKPQDIAARLWQNAHNLFDFGHADLPAREII